jgi:carbon storage regulator CsrA
MLVLSRKNGETVCISRGIEVKVLSISRNSVKLGFSPPPQVDIRRQELDPLPKRHAPSVCKSAAETVVCHSLESY